MGLFKILMQTSDWAEKFGLRTGKFGLAIEKFGLRTGKVRTSDSVRTFARPRKKLRTGSDCESSDFGLSPDFRAARKNFEPDRTGKVRTSDSVRTFARLRKKLRTGPDWPKQTSDCSPESGLHPPPCFLEKLDSAPGQNPVSLILFFF